MPLLRSRFGPLIQRDGLIAASGCPHPNLT